MSSEAPTSGKEFGVEISSPLGCSHDTKLGLDLRALSEAEEALKNSDTVYREALAVFRELAALKEEIQSAVGDSREQDSSANRSCDQLSELRKLLEDTEKVFPDDRLRLRSEQASSDDCFRLVRRVPPLLLSKKFNFTDENSTTKRFP